MCVVSTVIDNTLVDRVCLGRRLPRDPVTSRDLPADGDRAVTPDADPQHRQRAQRRLPPQLRRRTTEEDLINDDPGTGMRHRRHPFDPRRLECAELRPEDDRTV